MIFIIYFTIISIETCETKDRITERRGQCYWINVEPMVNHERRRDKRGTRFEIDDFSS